MHAVVPPSSAPAALSTRAAARLAKRRHFRADIQAIRATAVVLVVIYHLRPNRLPGGFVGVDVFFVISGFLITSHLIREATRTGRVKLGAFWAARARRILPASLIALVATIAVTTWVAPVTLFDDLRKQALASLFYVQNWILALDAVDYSAAENDATPFQHFWSLSVEEQFYLFWPLLVVASLWLVARRSGGARDPQRFRRILGILFGVVVAASLAFSIWAVAEGQPSAYFVTVTRIWELGAGGLLALVGARRMNRAWRYGLAYAGLAAIAVSAFVLTHETPFPGLAALPVILGTMALILAGTPQEPADQDDDVSLSRFDPWTFGSRLGIVQWIGDRSYSLYLWHFPVIIVWTMLLERDIAYIDIIGMLVLSVVLADYSYRLIEQPMRSASYFRTSTRRSLVGGIIAMVVVAALTFAYPAVAAQGAASWGERARAAQALPSLGADSPAGAKLAAFATSDKVMTPSPLEAGRDEHRALSEKKCVARQMNPGTPMCEVGDPASTTSIALVGDSHSRMYGTAFAAMTEAEGWHLRTFMHNACPFNPLPREIELDGEVICSGPNAETMAALLADPPDVLVTTWYMTATYPDDGSETVPGATGFAEYWNALEAAGTDVLVLRDVPRLDEDAADCVAQHYEQPDQCATPRGEALQGKKMLADAVSLAPDVTVADMTDLFCDASVCKVVIGNVLAYKDRHHITDTFALTMRDELTAHVEALLATR